MCEESYDSEFEAQLCESIHNCNNEIELIEEKIEKKFAAPNIPANPHRVIFIARIAEKLLGIRIELDQFDNVKTSNKKKKK